MNNKPIFIEEENAQLLLNCIYNFRAKGMYLLLGFVIMPTHLHILLVPNKGFNVSTVMHSIKRSSSRLLSNFGYKKGPLWQPSFYEHVIRNKHDFREKLRYIYNNSVKAGLVKYSERFKFSSANPQNSNDLDKYYVG